MELNGYRIMWLFVFFDLPTETKKIGEMLLNFERIY